MKTESFSFLSKDGRTKIHAVKWLPDSGEGKAVIQLTHGMIEYIERYENFAKFLTDNDFIVYGHDHIGHGHSVRSKKDLGYFTENRPSDVLIDDMHHVRCIAQGEQGDKPYFMFAHSMGSFLLRKYLTKYNDNLTGAIICGTGYSTAQTTNMGLRITWLASKAKNSHFRSQFITNLTYSKAYKKFDMTGKNPKNSWLTRDEEVVKKYYSDSLCSYLFTMNGYKGLMEAVGFSCKQENVNKIPSRLPIFIISGEDDPVGDLGVGVRQVYNMFRRSGKKDLSFKLYEGFRHEILNEIGKEEVYNDVLKWMNARIK